MTVKFSSTGKTPPFPLLSFSDRAEPFQLKLPKRFSLRQTLKKSIQMFKIWQKYKHLRRGSLTSKYLAIWARGILICLSCNNFPDQMPTAVSEKPLHKLCSVGCTSVPGTTIFMHCCD